MRDYSDVQGEHLAVNFHITLSHFDEVIGPETIVFYPELNNPFKEKIKQLVPHLLDINLEELIVNPFIYINDYFQSYNLGFSLPKLDGRAAESDYMISIIITPSDTRGLIGLVGLRYFLPTLREACVSALLSWHKHNDMNRVRTELIEQFASFKDDVINFFNTQLSSWGKGMIHTADFDTE